MKISTIEFLIDDFPFDAIKTANVPSGKVKITKITTAYVSPFSPKANKISGKPKLPQFIIIVESEKAASSSFLKFKNFESTFEIIHKEKVKITIKIIASGTKDAIFSLFFNKPSKIRHGVKK